MKHEDKRKTKIDINIKNMSSSPKKDLFRAMSPNLNSKKIFKVKTGAEKITRDKFQSPVRNTVKINNEEMKIRSNLLIDMKNNNNITKEKLINEFYKSKVMLPAISEKILPVSNLNVIKTNKSDPKNFRLSRSNDSIKDQQPIPKSIRSNVKNLKPQSPKNFFPKQSNNVRIIQSPAQSNNVRIVQSPAHEDKFNKNYISNNVKISSIETKKICFPKEKFFYYIILPGNNSILVKNCMNHRVNWKECPSSATSIFHFKWQQSSAGVDFNNFNRVASIKQSFNHFEGHPQISNKLNLFVNLFKYCELNGLDVFKYIPFTIIIQYESPNYLVQMDNFSKLFNNIKDYVNYNPETKKTSKSDKRYSNLFSISQSEKLGVKTNVYIHPTHYDGKNIWLIKAPDLNRGRCIKIGNNLSNIQKLIKKFYEGIIRDFKLEEQESEHNQQNYKLQSKEEEIKKIKQDQTNYGIGGKKYRTNLMLLQKYIEKPLLYYGRKFDIRIWVLITHELDVYAFKEGHLKTASLPYNNNNIDTFVHLTNYSVQKYNDNFSKFEYGNEVSFKDFQTFLNITYPDKKIDIKQTIFKKIIELIKITFKAVKDKLKEGKKYTFEIFGYDFILDCNFDMYLLEINTNPGLEESSPLISKLLPRMIDDALRLTIDTIYESNCSCLNNGKYYSPYYVDNYSDSENLWDLVCKNNDSDYPIKGRKQ